MPVISALTARRIWEAHHEIVQAEQLLIEMVDYAGRERELTPPDAFGRQHRAYQFGIPHGDNGHRLYGVSPRLGRVVVEGHIAEMRRQLEELSAIARLELDSTASAASSEDR